MTNVIYFPPPNNKKELFARLKKTIAAGWQEMPASEKRYNGTGAPGNYLEDLLGLRAGNKDVPDVIGWEVKYYNPKTHLITLFHKEPQPEKILHYMVNRYGWKDRYGRKSFRHTIRGTSDRFIVVNDAGNVIVRPLQGNGVVPMWTHDVLYNVVASKLRRLMLVKGERKGRMVRFTQVDCYEELIITRLVEEMVKGTIAIDFDVREMTAGSAGLRNHGTKFRVAPDDIAKLYSKKTHLT